VKEIILILTNQQDFFQLRKKEKPGFSFFHYFLLLSNWNKIEGKSRTPHLLGMTDGFGS
jgi:hypothetical protein